MPHVRRSGMRHAIVAASPAIATYHSTPAGVTRGYGAACSRSCASAQDALTKMAKIIACVSFITERLSSGWDNVRWRAQRLASLRHTDEICEAKASAVADDVNKLHVLSDALTHTGLARFCHNTRLPYLNRNLPLTVASNGMWVALLLAAHRLPSSCRRCCRCAH